MELKKLLKKRADLFLEVRELKEKSGLGEMEKNLEDLDSSIKTLAREASDEDIAAAVAGRFFLRVDRPWKKFYDFEAIKKYAKKSELDLITKEALKVEVDKPKFEELVAAGLVSKEVKQKAFKEEEQTPRVSILEKKDE